MLYSIAGYVTDFADQAVALPLVVIGAAMLARAGWRRGAAVWAAAAFATFGLTLLLKFVFLACYHADQSGAMRGPSGHTASAGVVYGGLALLVARVGWAGKPVGWDLLALLPTVAMVALIGLSRLVLGVHTAPEVVFGAVLAGSSVVAMSIWAGRPPTDLNLRPMLLALTLVALLLHGARAPAEAAIARLAHDIWPRSACQNGAD